MYIGTFNKITDNMIHDKFITSSKIYSCCVLFSLNHDAPITYKHVIGSGNNILIKEKEKHLLQNEFYIYCVYSFNMDIIDIKLGICKAKDINIMKEYHYNSYNECLSHHGVGIIVN